MRIEILMKKKHEQDTMKVANAIIDEYLMTDHEFSVNNNNDRVIMDSQTFSISELEKVRKRWSHVATFEIM
ncbi:MAG TPA: hypothetical protein VGO63_03880 [Candidatus Paceibacterota bacterium]|jgi:hypothetical protein|nr:hypothetical protein [Candidatus Paceibacterota bacterium]